MMTYEQVLATAKALGDDALVFAFGRRIDVDFNDFEGFDDDWSEIMRDYDDEEAVEAFKEMLTSKAVSIEDGFYTIYHFNDFDVRVGYTSYDI